MQTNKNTAVAERKTDAMEATISRTNAGRCLVSSSTFAGSRQCVKVEESYSGIYDHPSTGGILPAVFKTI